MIKDPETVSFLAGTGAYPSPGYGASVKVLLGKPN